MTANKHTLDKFQPEIQGLRAIAILLVVMAHASVPGMASGFIGVDIFFVISGYLITGLIIRDLEENKSFSFTKFIVRRMQRLLPALMAMLVLVSIASVLLLSPFEQTNQSNTAGFAALWVSNIYFAFSNLGYFEASNKTNLFLHTWSLGVEEQFYLVWPVLILTLYKVVAKTKSDHRTILAGFLFILLLSLAASIYLTSVQPLWGFYLMPSRAWQFSMGAVIMVLTTNHTITVSKNQAGIASMTGVLCLAISLIFIEESSLYPGLWALIPTIGTALILLGIKRCESGLVTSFLRLAPLQKIGDMSYSWYLWHWPVIVLGTLVLYDSSAYVKTTLAVMSVLPSILSFYLVESPVRKIRNIFKRSFTGFISSLLLMVALFSMSKIWAQQITVWQESDDQKAIQLSLQDLPKLYSMGCDEWYHSAELKVCAFGNVNAKHKVVLLGDSLGAQWYSALATEYATEESLLLVVTKSSCPIVDEPYYYDRIGRMYTECETWRNTALDWMTKLEPDIIFIGSNNARFSKDQWIDGSTKVLEKLVHTTKNVFILRATPQLAFHGLSCLSRRSWQGNLLGEVDQCSSSVSNQYAENVYSWLTKASAKFDNVNIIDLNDFVCPDKVCNAELNGMPVFRDRQHLTNEFVSTLDDKMKTLVSEYIED